MEPPYDEVYGVYVAAITFGLLEATYVIKGSAFAKATNAAGMQESLYTLIVGPDVG